MSLDCLVCPYFSSGYLPFTHSEDWAGRAISGIITCRHPWVLMAKQNSASSRRDGRGGFGFQKKKKNKKKKKKNTNGDPKGLAETRSEKPEGCKD